MLPVDLLVEGSLDAAVCRRVLKALEIPVGTEYGFRGWHYVASKVSMFASSGSPLLALVDLMDTQLPFPPAVVSHWLDTSNSLCVFRVAVREIESWLLADRHQFSNFFGVTLAKVPQQPDYIEDPKLTLVNLCRRSRHPSIRLGIPPRTGLAVSEGPSYTPLLSAYVNDAWRPEVAAESSPSLRKMLLRVNELRQRIVLA